MQNKSILNMNNWFVINSRKSHMYRGLLYNMMTGTCMDDVTIVRMILSEGINYAWDMHREQIMCDKWHRDSWWLQLHDEDNGRGKRSRVINVTMWWLMSEWSYEDLENNGNRWQPMGYYSRYVNARYANARYANVRLWKYGRYGWNARYVRRIYVLKRQIEISFINGNKFI